MRRRTFSISSFDNSGGVPICRQPWYCRASVSTSTASHIAFGSVGPTVVRLRRTERVLSAGGPLKQAQAVLRGEITPIDDVRSTAEYRLQVSANLLADFWHVTRK